MTNASICAKEEAPDAERPNTSAAEHRKQKKNKNTEMQKQINCLAAILTAGLTQKTNEHIDWTAADWDVILDFLRKNRLMGVANSGFAQYKENGLPLPDQKVRAATLGKTVNMTLETTALHASMIKFGRAWEAEGKRPLALGGMAFAAYYPSPRVHYATELECMELYKEGKKEDANAETSFEVDRLKVKVVDSATGSFDSKNRGHEEAVLRKAFMASPCTLDRSTLVAYPNLNFLALYLVYTAQKQLMCSHLPFGKVLDWAMVLRRIGKSEANKFDGELFLEQVGDLGLLPFVQSFTGLAVRLTGVDVPASGKSLLVDGVDTDFLFRCILDETKAPADNSSRFSRFVDVLRNKKKYDQFTEQSPTKLAFRYLFGKE